MEEREQVTLPEGVAVMRDELIKEFEEMARDPKVLEEAEKLHKRIGIPSPEALLRRFTI